MSVVVKDDSACGATLGIAPVFESGSPETRRIRIVKHGSDLVIRDDEPLASTWYELTRSASPDFSHAGVISTVKASSVVVTGDGIGLSYYRATALVGCP